MYISRLTISDLKPLFLRHLDLLEEAEPVAEVVDNDVGVDDDASRTFDVETRALETPEILLGNFFNRSPKRN